MKAETVAVNEKRLAALTLHSLSAADRDWVLDRMPGPQRDELESLLSELVSLGIPSDPELVGAALKSSASLPVPTTPPVASLQVEPQVLADMLTGEPDALALRCLSLLDATARDVVIRLLPEDRRAGLTRRHEVAKASALTAALERLIKARVAEQAARHEVWR